MGEFRYMGHAMPYLPKDGCTGKLIVIEGTDGCGRSTQAIMLKEWLEVQGYAVIDTGWTRSKLVGQAITDAKQGHSLHRLTYCLMYAVDLADRMEYQIIPALRSGFIVLADRYIYTLLARGVARDADKQWLRDLFSFAVQPDLVFYLRLDVKDLVPRVLEAGKMNYWESGLDMNYGDDLFDSFIAYQTELIEQFNLMTQEYGFHTLDAHQDPRTIQRQLRRAVTEYLQQSNYPAPGAAAAPTQNLKSQI
ncbi:MAG: thymidylate kinase [Tepidisphaeraceae bacterium]|jgi:dTMP kinase